MTTIIEKCPTCGCDAIDRSEFWECVVENSSEISTQLNLIREAITKYHFALDRREHGAIAQDRAFGEICEVLNMHWEPNPPSRKTHQITQ
ncbi:hypothetical protein [Pseudoalteromonas luteoviolacea]|uniref:hypothetical protein n=1 Tax=Pseudoalteromonas luteoviolacea TaxID=43657 RepID=UPI001B378FB7|nr:hypothetical protein [Pseudoalteromonas luteoviolacea]MBQ4836798.1 hypothetical protein [Pseudoalteromonas luteoviolacea]